MTANGLPAPPSAANQWMLMHVLRLERSLYTLTGRHLQPYQTIDGLDAERVFKADFALLSHGMGPDPLFNYANQRALNLFELDWPRLLETPSRASAPPGNQAEREAFMRKVLQLGYCDDYTGERVSSSGRRFTINRATVWNVTDGDNEICGQAAMFAHWTFLES